MGSIATIPDGLDPRSRALLSRCASALERAGLGLEIRDCDAPEPALRARLEIRAATLQQALAPCGREARIECVSVLYQLIPARDDGAETTVDTVTKIAAVLSGEPLWAIQAACRRVIDSGARFRPGGPELLKLAREEAAAARLEAGEIDRVLSARIVRNWSVARERERAKGRRV